MSEKIPVYLFITPDKILPEEINELTRELGQILEESNNDQIKYIRCDSLPHGTKTVELVFAQQVIIQLIPLVTPWILGKIDDAVKIISKRIQKAINVTVQIGAHEIHITHETTSQELAKYEEIIKSTETIQGNRYALIIGNSTYSEKALPSLNSSEIDGKLFSDILRDPKIGAFSQVTTLINKDSHTVLKAIEDFFQNRQKEDLLLLYFSGHGVKNKLGQLFLATQNTDINFIRSTGVSSNFIKENMDSSSSQRQILILDCCYSGAIVTGAKSKNIIGQSANSISAFQSSGFGRVIIAASEAMQLAFDGEGTEGHPENSLFTKHLIEGLKTGQADTDNDGLVDVEELYQYAYNNVVPKQTPNISVASKQGKLYISINPNPKIHPAELPEKLQEAIKSDDKYSKQGAIRELSLMLKKKERRIAIAAENALKELTTDDSLSICKMAKEALEQYQGSHQIKIITTTTTQPIHNRKAGFSSQESQVPQPVTLNNPVEPFIENPTTGKGSTKKNTEVVKKNEALGGVLNMIIYGAGFVYVNNWKKARITFFYGIIALVLLIIMAGFDSFILSGPLIIVGYIVLYVAGNREVKYYNQKLINKNDL